MFRSFSTYIYEDSRFKYFQWYLPAMWPRTRTPMTSAYGTRSSSEILSSSFILCSGYMQYNFRFSEAVSLCILENHIEIQANYFEIYHFKMFPYFVLLSFLLYTS